MSTGHALTQATTAQIVAAYSAPPCTVPAVAASPGWHVVGEFFMPLRAEARFDVLLGVSNADLTARARLFDLSASAPAPVNGSEVSTQSTTPVRLLSAIVELQGGRIYQMQVECVGGSAEGLFALLQTATVTN